MADAEPSAGADPPAEEPKAKKGGKKKKSGKDAQRDLLALSANPEEFLKEKKKLLKTELEMQLELLDETPERMQLFKRREKDGYCKCKECAARRVAIAVRRVDWGLERIHEMYELDLLVQYAARGGKDRQLYIDETIKKYGQNALVYQGGPVFIYGCMACKLSSKDPCYHCGREVWMKTQKEVYIMRKDMKKVPRFLETTVLHAACMNGHVRLVERLIEMGAPIDGQDSFGCTPLHWCTCQGHRAGARNQQLLRIAELLLQAGAKVTLLDLEQKTPAELTFPPNPPWNMIRQTILKHRRPELNRMLLEYCQSGVAEGASRMIHAGADLGCSDWLGDTPFHIAVTFGHIELFLDLVEIAKSEGRLLGLLKAKSVEGFSLINMATKWGYWTLAERIKGLTQEAEIKETVAAAVQGGGSIPPQFKGTMLGKRMEAELKRQQGIKQRLVKNLRLEQKAAAREKARTTYFARGEQAGAGGSSTCVVM